MLCDFLVRWLVAGHYVLLSSNQDCKFYIPLGYWTNASKARKHKLTVSQLAGTSFNSQPSVIPVLNRGTGYGFEALINWKSKLLCQNVAVHCHQSTTNKFDSLHTYAVEARRYASRENSLCFIGNRCSLLHSRNKVWILIDASRKHEDEWVE